MTLELVEMREVTRAPSSERAQNSVSHHLAKSQNGHGQNKTWSGMFQIYMDLAISLSLMGKD